MDRTTAWNNVDIGAGRRGYRDKNKSAGIGGTGLAAADRNAIQEELLAIIEAAGLVPSAGNWAQVLQAIRVLRGGKAEFITTSQAWVVPPGVTRVRFRMWAGGGGGGGSANPNSAAAGGGAGAYVEGYLVVTPGQILNLTVGAGGIGGVAGIAGGTGGAGGSTIILNYASCGGGGGGTGANGIISSPGGAAGTPGITAGVNAKGFTGLGGGTGFVTGDNGRTGGGGGPAFSSAAPGSAASDATTPQIGGTASLPGAGAAGGVAGGNGGKGADGLIILEY
ncbi:hypothetical protein VQH23_07360 [Pararoseomonas sp. SCSIO 73927]|uniref:glycine-rich domain-containing protein n=1 Tax=Pararoseomonas sp. SCSIO 73927 TaxID=3114537 RepID=UPI0030D0D558